MSKMQISSDAIAKAIDYYNNLKDEEYDDLLNEYIDNQPAISAVTLSIPEDVKVSEDAEDKMADLSVVIWKAVMITFPDFKAIDEEIIYKMQDKKQEAYETACTTLKKELKLTDEEFQEKIDLINATVEDSDDLDAMPDIEHAETIIKTLDITTEVEQKELIIFVNEMLDNADELDENEKSMIYSVLEVIISTYDYSINN